MALQMAVTRVAKMEFQLAEKSVDQRVGSTAEMKDLMSVHF